MDTKSNRRLSGLISKLTLAANQSIKKEKENRKFTVRTEKSDYHASLTFDSINANLRPS